MNQKSVDEIVQLLPTINKKVNYWFVRTNGGQYYEDFRNRGMIAIDWDNVSRKKIEETTVFNDDGSIDEDASISSLGKAIKDKDEENNRAYYEAAQIFNFSHKIKKNDIVLIPSRSSEYITFGRVLGTRIRNVKVEVDKNDKKTCPWIKRKKVEWLETVQREHLDPKLYRLMYSHHAITEAKDYDVYIDRVLNSFYIKDNQAFYSLNVKTTQPIDARDFFLMGADSLELLDEFCDYAGIKREKTDVINVKSNLQSPGEIILSGWVYGILALGLILVFLNGGVLKGKYEEGKLNIEANAGAKGGIIDKVRKFCSTISKNKRQKEMVRKFMAENKIQDAKELKDILGSFNENEKE